MDPEQITEAIDTLLDESRTDEVAALDDEQIGALDAALLAHYQAIRAGEIDGTDPEDLAALGAVRDARNVVLAEVGRRYEAAETAAAEAAARAEEALALDAEMGVAETEAGPDDDENGEENEAAEETEAEAEVVEEAEAVVAAAHRPSLAEMAAASRPAETRPAPVVTATPRWESLDGHAVTMVEAASRIIAARESLSYVAPGIQDRLTVCRVKADRPADQKLQAHLSPYQNRAVTDNATEGAQDPATWSSPEVAPIVASGGWCAPLEPRYDVFDVVQAGRPARDGVPSLQVDRGGVRIVRSDGIAGITSGLATGAVSIWDAATDATPGENTKGRQTMDCETIVDIELDAIVTRMRFGNFQARAFPELVASDIKNAAGRHARVAEGELLDDWIGQINTDVTEVAVLGTWRDLREALLRAVAQLRSTQRAGDAILGVFLPSWVRDAALADVTRQQASGEIDALLAGPAQVLESLRGANVNPRFYWDTPTTGTSQLFGNNSDNESLANWPTVIQAIIYFEGSLLFGDGGLLNVGIVRDSTLNNTNDYELFSETFETGIYLGPKALHLSLTHCPNGESQVATDETGAVCSAS